MSLAEAEQPFLNVYLVVNLELPVANRVGGRSQKVMVYWTV
jgi:hypothetical protein